MSLEKTIPDPYELCYCHSGKKYKFCHYELDRASGIERYDISKRSYLEKWKSNAENFMKQDCYGWMARTLENFHPTCILDIGCGEGSGILAITETLDAPHILSVDDNLNCLKSARLKCASRGIRTELIERFKVSAEEKSHRLSVIPGRLSFTSNVTLVEGDLLWDEELERFIGSLPGFDAITVWLIGTYDIKLECRNIAKLHAFSETGKYRALLHQRTYQLADRILPTGGVVHFVDRGDATNQSVLRQGCLEEHESLAAQTSFKTWSYDAFSYFEAEGPQRVTMERRFVSETKMPESQRLALTSITAIKQ